MGLVQFCRSAGSYALFVLCILMLAYLVNQMDRYVLSVCSKPMANDIHFGNRVCEAQPGASVGACSNQTDQPSCEVKHSGINITCTWAYSGTGFEYEVLAGPVFIVMFTIVGVGLSPLVDRPSTNRRLVLSLLVLAWSLMNIFASLANSYWQLVVTRLGLGMFEAVCTPFAISLISDFFDKTLQGTAIGIYNWGIYIGVSMAFAFKELVTAVGWRWTYRVSGFPGLLLAPVIFFAIREPKRRSTSFVDSQRGHFSSRQLTLWQMLREVLRLEIALVCLASGVRTAGGYVLLYSINTYFSSRHVNVAIYMSWVPLVGGILGATIGGYMSDKLMRRHGLQGRVALIVMSQLLAAPFAFGLVLLNNATLAFASLLVTFVLGEAYLGVSLALVTALVKSRTRTVAVAVFLFITSNMGGNSTLLVPIFNGYFAHGLRDTLLLLYSASYLIGGLIFSLVLLLMRHRGIGLVSAASATNGRTINDDSCANSDDRAPLLGNSPSSTSMRDSSFNRELDFTSSFTT